MIIKAKIVQTQFIHPENSDVTICKLSASIVYPADAILQAILTRIAGKYWRKHKRLFWDFTIIGKAKLAKGDTFDFEKGEKVAEAKAKAKLFKRLCKITLDMNNEALKIQDIIYKDNKSYINLVYKEDLHITELSL